MKKFLLAIASLIGHVYVFAAVPLGIMFLYSGFTYNRYFQVVTGIAVFVLLWKVTHWLDLM